MHFGTKLKYVSEKPDLHFMLNKKSISSYIKLVKRYIESKCAKLYFNFFMINTNSLEKSSAIGVYAKLQYIYVSGFFFFSINPIIPIQKYTKPNFFVTFLFHLSGPKYLFLNYIKDPYVDEIHIYKRFRDPGF